MKSNNSKTTTRNWFLVFICSILLALGLSLIAVAIASIATFGWWSILFGLCGTVTVCAATMSIIKNDPSWILLDLILPG